MATLACVLASGPSLTDSDIEATKHLFTIGINSTSFYCEPDIAYAYDAGWWNRYYKQVKQIGCEMVTASRGYVGAGVNRVEKVSGYSLTDAGVVGSNSGLHGICLAYMRGFRDIILLGFDCQHTGGKAHHFGDHPKPLGNASKPERWIDGFNRIAKSASEVGVRIINCSRATSLDCFERMTLQEALDGYRNN